MTARKNLRDTGVPRLAHLVRERTREQPWTTISADIIGALPRSKAGFMYILVIQDLFTRWVECCPLRVATGVKIWEALENLVVSRWGTPRYILTNNGIEFANKILRKFANECGIELVITPPYHPQANPVERVNRVLKTMIVAYLKQDHREWDRYLDDFRFAYNSAHHTSFSASSAFLNFEKELESPHTLR